MCRCRLKKREGGEGDGVLSHLIVLRDDGNLSICYSDHFSPDRTFEINSMSRRLMNRVSDHSQFFALPALFHPAPYSLPSQLLSIAS